MHADGILLDDTVFFFLFFFFPERFMCVCIGGGVRLRGGGIIHFSLLLLFEIFGHIPY